VVPDQPATVDAALRIARALGLARLDAQLLLAYLLNCPRTWVLAHDEFALASEEAERFVALARRRADGVPLAVLVGFKEFHGLMLKVTPDVLCPRPETEILVDWALELLAAQPGQGPACDVVDLGTGSGAIALAVATAFPTARVTGVDVSTSALAVAAENNLRLGQTVEWIESSWWEGLAQRRFHLAVSNPPYIAADDPHLHALVHEPLLALTPGGDGLSALRSIIESAPEHLHSGAWLLVEHGFDQAEAVRAALQNVGMVEVSTRADLAGLARCTGARKPGPPAC
jgi:release factor glutamine methyltransferase